MARTVIYRIVISCRVATVGAPRRGRAAGWCLPARCGWPGWRRRRHTAVPTATPASLRVARGPAIVLELGERAFAGVPCWSGRAERWAAFTVPIAYDLRYDTQVRPVLGANQVSRTAVLAVARARAGYAEYGTGRGSRPCNERLAADTGYSVRTVQRADTALRLLGVATEVLRGRQRTRTERLASWRVGDRGRGWASVWALHDDAALARQVGKLSPHPEGSSFSSSPSRRNVVTTGASRPTGVAKSSLDDGQADLRTHGIRGRGGWRRRGGLIRTARRGRDGSPPTPGRESWPAPRAHGWCSSGRESVGPGLDRGQGLDPGRSAHPDRAAGGDARLARPRPPRRSAGRGRHGAGGRGTRRGAGPGRRATGAAHSPRQQARAVGSCGGGRCGAHRGPRGGRRAARRAVVRRTASAAADAARLDAAVRAARATTGPSHYE